MEKGFSSDSFPKTFNFNLSLTGVYPVRLKSLLKSLERGSGESLSPERFPPLIPIKLLYERCSLTNHVLLYKEWYEHNDNADNHKGNLYKFEEHPVCGHITVMMVKRKAFLEDTHKQGYKAYRCQNSGKKRAYC